MSARFRRSVALCDGTLGHHARRLAVPTYDRSALTPSVVHLSVGSFHRSHQAVYFDDLAQQGVSRDWGLVGVGLRSPEMGRVLRAQDGLYTVVARSADADEGRVIGVIGRYVFSPDDGAEVVAALVDPRVRLVTLTITQGGYGVAGRLTPAIRHLVEALARRRRLGLAPFTVLSCDNVADNGAVVREAVVAAAERRDAPLARWIDQAGAFPGSMVDRITPHTTTDDRDWITREFGVRDRWPVVTEPFSQWVVEDEFCAGRPPLDEVGVDFVSDVRPYSLLKTRLLNASHCALGALGSLVGHEGTAEAMDDPVLGAYVARMMEDEISPLLDVPAGVSLPDYRATLLERLANPKVGDRLSRLCRSGSSKVPLHVLSSLRQARGEGAPHGLLTLAVAGWMRLLRGVDEHSAPVLIDDPMAESLAALARTGGTDPRPLLRERAVFGDLVADEGLVAALARDLRGLERYGTRAVVAERLADATTVAV